MNMMFPLALTSAVLATAGCAISSPSREARTWDDGWRQAKVIRIKDQLEWFQSPACDRMSLPSERYVVLEYREHGRPKWQSVAMASQSLPEVGALVDVNLRSCQIADPKS